MAKTYPEYRIKQENKTLFVVEKRFGGVTSNMYNFIQGCTSLAEAQEYIDNAYPRYYNVDGTEFTPN